MPNPHDKFPLLVARSEQLLRSMHDRLFSGLKYASEVYMFPDPDIFPCDTKAWYWTMELPYPTKKVLQLHICCQFRNTNFLCMREKTCNAENIRENRKEMRIQSISCMRKAVCVAGLATQCVTVTLFSSHIPEDSTVSWISFTHRLMYALQIRLRLEECNLSC